MNEIAAKLQGVEREIRADKGPFAYFALVREGEAPDRWDLVVSAPWISANRMEGIRYIAERLKGELTPQELISLSKIVALDEGHPYLMASRTMVPGLEGGLAEMSGHIIDGMILPETYIITSQLPGGG